MRRIASALLVLVLAALGAVAVTLLLELTVSVLTNEAKVIASFVSMGVTLANVALLIVLEVRAWHAIVTAAEERDGIDGSGKVLLALALWFVGGFPMNLATLLRSSVLGIVDAEVEILLVQMALTFVFAVFAVLKLYPVLLGRGRNAGGRDAGSSSSPING